MSLVLKHTVYLAIQRKSSNLRPMKVRATERPPALSRGEICISVNLEIPEILFSTPQLKATVKIPDGAVSPPVISADVASNIADVVKTHTGLDITIAVEPGPTKKR